MTERQQAAARLPEAARRGRVFGALGPAGADALLVTAPADVRYLSGFSGTSGWVLLVGAGGFFLTDPRYTEQAAAEVEGLEVVVSAQGLPNAVAAVPDAPELGRIGFEPGHVTVSVLKQLQESVAAEWVPVAGVVAEQRSCKDEHERLALREALQLTEAALVEVAATIRPGQTERQVAADLERACRRRGGEGMAFETIVASGVRTALPHGVATDRMLAADEPVMIDMGCRLNGYCADITRNVWCGPQPRGEWLKLHDTVDRARLAAIAAARAGVGAAAVDAAARDLIAVAGHGDGFVHGTGHGVGLEIHEKPTLSARSDEVLRQGMVVTIEPAVYLAGRFGVRIEDMVCVDIEGCDRLTTLSTEPILPPTS